MTDNKNMELNDEAMENAAGGDLDPNYEIATVTGIVMVDPRPEQPWVWESVQESGRQAYEITGGRIAVAPGEMDSFNVGDEVYVAHVRSFYSWSIKGAVDDM